MFVLDTDVISNLRKKKPHPTLGGWMGEVGWQELATTSVTIMEVQIGIERARRSDAATGAGLSVRPLHGQHHLALAATLPLCRLRFGGVA